MRVSPKPSRREKPTPCNIESRDTPVAETRDLDENTLLDVDADGNTCAITVEHASQRADIPQFSYEQVATA